MPKLTKKQRKAGLTAAVTLAVYVGFRFLLPLVLPFVLSYVIALCLHPSAVWLERRLRFSLFGKKWAVPIGLIGAFELLLCMAVLCLVCYLGGLCLLREMQDLTKAVPEWLKELEQRLMELCRTTEGLCHLDEGVFALWVREWFREAESGIKKAWMPDLLFHSIGAVGFLLKAAIFSVVLLLAVILSLQEMEELRSRSYASLYHREIFLLGRRLCQTGSAWLKTQAVILVFNSGLCVFTLACMGNPYAVLAGIGIGLLDALPVFGAGAVLLPWSFVLFLKQQWGRAVLILGLDLICYFFREFTEARLMGKKVGLSALETLVSIYAGLKLFGCLGFLLGPIGLLMIRDFVEEYDPAGKNGV